MRPKDGIIQPVWQPKRSPTLEDEPSDVERKGSGGVTPVESEGTTLQSQPAATADLPIPVFLQGGSATVDEEGDDDDDGPKRNPSIAPPVPDGRRSMESRRSTDSRPSHEERRGSGQYAVVSTAGVPGSTSPPSKKRVRVLTDSNLDPIDPRFHAPSRSPNTTTSSPSGERVRGERGSEAP